MMLCSLALNAYELVAVTFIPETTIKLLANRCMLPFGPNVFAHVTSVSLGSQGKPLWVE